MATKQVVERKKSADYVLEIGKTQLGVLVPGLVKELSLPDDAAVKALLEASLARLAAARDELITVDEKLATEDSQDTGARATRDAAAADAFEQVVRARAAVDSAYGDELTEPVFSAGSTPQDPNALIAYGKNATTRLRETTLPAPLQGVAIDPAALASGLDEKLDALQTALAGVTSEERETQLARQRRHQVLDVFDNVFSAIAGQLEAYFALTGHSELSDRVRPSSRRPGTTVTPPSPSF